LFEIEPDEIESRPSLIQAARWFPEMGASTGTAIKRLRVLGRSPLDLASVSIKSSSLSSAEDSATE
jgi:hypothetical protein